MNDTHTNISLNMNTENSMTSLNTNTENTKLVSVSKVQIFDPQILLQSSQNIQNCQKEDRQLIDKVQFLHCMDQIYTNVVN